MQRGGVAYRRWNKTLKERRGKEFYTEGELEIIRNRMIIVNANTFMGSI